jgi:tRNA G26 N,N-dimethylase Trm1
MVKVFKTSVKTKKQAREILSVIAETFPDASASFDLEDCDKILRIESGAVSSEPVIQIISKAGFFGIELE